MDDGRSGPSKRRRLESKVGDDSAVGRRAPAGPRMLPGLSTWSADACALGDEEDDLEEETSRWRARRDAWFAHNLALYKSEGVDPADMYGRYLTSEAATPAIEAPAASPGHPKASTSAPVALDAAPSSRSHDVARVPAFRSHDAEPALLAPDLVAERSAERSASVVDVSKSSSGKGRGRGKAKKPVVYDKLSRKQKETYSTLDTFTPLLQEIYSHTSNALLDAQVRSSPIFTGMRFFFLLHPRRNGKLDELSRRRLIRISESGGIVDPVPQLGVTTHILTSEPAASMSWDTSWRMLRSHLGHNEDKWRELLEAPTGSRAPLEVVWLVDQTWLLESLKLAQTGSAVPERYHRILPPNKRGVSVARSTSRLDKSVAAPPEPPRPVEFIGAPNNSFQMRHGNDDSSTQNSAFHTSDYRSSTTSPALPQVPLAPSPPEGVRPLPVTASAPMHKALQKQIVAATKPAPNETEEQEESLIIENSGEVSVAAAEQAVTVPAVSRQVENQLGREIQMARLGDGGEWETDPHFLFDSSEGEPDTSDEESDGRPKKPVVKRVSRAKTDGKYQCDRAGKPGAADRKNGQNEDICQVLDKLVSLYGPHPGDEWRIMGLRRAIGVLRNSSERLDDIVEAAKTGTHRRLQFSSEEDRIRQLFLGIYGVGERVARDWYTKGLRTLDDVRAEKHGISLHDGQRLGLRYYDDLQTRIPRSEAKALFENIKSTAAKIDKKLELYIMGSYRRGAPTCGDIDILVTRNTDDGLTHQGAIKKLCKRLFDSGLLTYKLSEPEDWDSLEAKFMGLCKLPDEGQHQRRIDILGVPFEELGAALIYFTGNDIFNRSIRLKARHMGYSLNQRGLYADVLRDKAKRNEKVTEGRKVASRTEQEIFDLLKVTWIEPHLRNV